MKKLLYSLTVLCLFGVAIYAGTNAYVPFPSTLPFTTPIVIIPPTNSPTDGYAIVASGNRTKWATSGANQTPWTANENAAGFKVTNINAVVLSQDALTNTVYGHTAFQSNISGYYNTVIGDSAMASATNVYGQIAIGRQALFNQLTDRLNIAIGNGCISGPTLPEDNVCIGRDIMVNYLGGNESQYDNVLVGNTAGESLRGAGNVGVGFAALSGSTSTGNTGSWNIGLGHYVGYNINGGSHNILIGDQVDPPNLAGNDQLVIGSLTHSAAGYFVIGSFSGGLEFGPFCRFTNGIASTLNSAKASTAITFPNTTVNWTNTLGTNIVLYINTAGVTGTTTSKNGQQIFSTLVGDMTLLFKPGDYFAVAYTVGTPTARWEPQ